VLDRRGDAPIELRPGMSVIPTIATKSQAREREAAAVAFKLSNRSPKS
jgi:membrane fusion protein, multidrug efflux system